MLVLVRHALRESVRRRVFTVVSGLTAVFLALFVIGVWQAYDRIHPVAGEGRSVVDVQVLAGATLLGLSMFAILFLGTVLAVFLTLGVVRGDAETGVLQQIVVRPVGRAQLLLARWIAAASVCAVYVVIVYVLAFAVIAGFGGWTPDAVVEPVVALVVAVALLAALSLLGSVLLSSTANGIATFMLFGAGLFAGLLGQVAHALDDSTLTTLSKVATWLLPFEALYQNGLAALTADARGVTGVIVQLGPFGGAQGAGAGLWVWSVAYLGLVGVAAVQAFARRDL